VLLGSAVLLLARSAALADTVPLPEADATGTGMSACPSQA